MRIILIGASGLIGNYFFHFLKKRKINVVGTYFKNKKKDLIRFNLNKDKITNRIKNLNEDDVVFIFSAFSNPGWISKNKIKAKLTNITSTKKLIKELKYKNCKVIFMSSVEVFDGKKGKFFENDLPNPLNFYGKTKLVIETFIKNNLSNYKIFRTSWNSDLVGGYRCVVELTYKTITQKNALMASDNLLSITYVKDLCEKMFKCIFLDENIIHIANSERITRYNLARKIQSISTNTKNMNFKKCYFKQIKYSEPRGLKNILGSKVLKKYNLDRFTKIDKIVSRKVSFLDKTMKL